MARTSISLSGMAENTRFVPDPITYARAAVATIGIQHTTYGYFYHALQVGSSVAMVTDLRQQLSLCREGMLFPHLSPSKLSNTCSKVGQLGWGIFLLVSMMKSMKKNFYNKQPAFPSTNYIHDLQCFVCMLSLQEGYISYPVSSLFLPF